MNNRLKTKGKKLDNRQILSVMEINMPRCDYEQVQIQKSTGRRKYDGNDIAFTSNTKYVVVTFFLEIAVTSL